ncbi:MAG: hypothetical protein QOD03_1163 [Verrucomicrobiota bacterium]|jgi:predicted aldo/keto reductase-like oxidoreductase
MKNQKVSRRQFLQTTALAGAALMSPWSLSNVLAAEPVAKRTAIDQVTLGKTGIKLSRLGMGTGVNSGHNQIGNGKEAFIRLVHHAYDQGITYFDCAQNYETFGWMGDALKGLPREKLFIQSKVPGKPEDVLATIDNHRKTFQTDYIDSLLVHCMTKDGWVDEWKRVMDGFNEAKERKWIHAKGVSCHKIGALREAVASNFNEVHLVRVNPQGWHMDDVTRADIEGNADVTPVFDQLKLMRGKDRGVIGMKIFGNGDFKTEAAREKSLRYAMSLKELNAVVIGFETPQQVDDTIKMMNRVLAEA